MFAARTRSLIRSGLVPLLVAASLGVAATGGALAQDPLRGPGRQELLRGPGGDQDILRNPGTQDILRGGGAAAAPAPGAGRPVPPASSGGGASPSTAPDRGGRTIAIDPNTCRQIVAHTPSADVAYQPGIGVDGRRVAPADLPGSGGGIGASDLPIEFRINVDLAQRLGLTQAQVNDRFGVATRQGLSIQDMTAAQVMIAGGQAYINGRPVGGEGQRELAALCRQAGLVR